MTPRRTLGFALGLCAALALLVGCAAPSTPSAPSEGRLAARAPAGVYRTLAEQDDRVLVEGAQREHGQLLPDGRLWLLEPTGDYRLLTPEHLFEGPFFAAGGVFLPDSSLVTKINFDQDGDNLYRIAPDGSAAHFLTDAPRLGLAGIDERTLRLEGRTLIFRAERTLYDPAAPDGFYVETAWYALSLDAPDKGVERLAAP